MILPTRVVARASERDPWFVLVRFASEIDSGIDAYHERRQHRLSNHKVRHILTHTSWRENAVNYTECDFARPF